MSKNLRRAFCFAVILLFALQSAVLAAANVKAVRFSSGAQHDRVVFDLTASSRYRTLFAKDGRTLTIDIADTAAKTMKRTPIHTRRIESASYDEQQGHLIVTLKLREGMHFEARTLQHPDRLFVDILDGAEKPAPQKPVLKPVPRTEGTTFDGDFVEDLAPGLTRHTYVYWDERGQVSVWLIEADRNRYALSLELGKGKVPGRETVSSLSDRKNAVAAINATYFAPSGDIIGVAKIDGRIVGTTYYRRSAMGIYPDGSTVFGKISYDGTVKLGGAAWPIGGVDCERGTDSLVIYNRAYGSTTGTNAYGQEYTVVNGRVMAIRTSDSPIPENGIVVSVHGTAADAFAGVKVGATAEIDENIERIWRDVPTVIGAGPRLVEDGRVHVTADEESFPSDIRDGRAPRSAIGVTADGNYILAVVDGRQSHSVGLTLTAWAELLKKFGAYNAINLDGGGSSELVVGGEIQNEPSDGSERPVGSAVILTAK